MHDKAEQIDRLISAFTCVVAAACLTTQELIVRDWYLCMPFPPIPQPSVILCQDVSCEINWNTIRDASLSTRQKQDDNLTAGISLAGTDIKSHPGEKFVTVQGSILTFKLSFCGRQM